MKVNGSQVRSCVGGVMAAILFACSLRTYMYVYRYTERMDDSVNRIEFYIYIYMMILVPSAVQSSFIM